MARLVVDRDDDREDQVSGTRKMPSLRQNGLAQRFDQPLPPLGVVLEGGNSVMSSLVVRDGRRFGADCGEADVHRSEILWVFVSY